MKIDITRDSFRREKHFHDVRCLQGRVQLDADQNELADIIGYLRETTGRDVIGRTGGPIDGAGFEIRPEGTGLTIGRGRYYLDGILVENDSEISFKDQTGVSRFPDLFSDPGEERGASTPFMAYLDVWQHAVTVLDDPEMREVALPCPDTSARTKNVWQVKLKKLDKAFLKEIGIRTPSGDCPSRDTAFCDERILERIEQSETSTGRLNARVSQDTEAQEPCTIASRRGYRGLENQLYRVEIHKGGRPGEATFKWSRENGSVAVLWDPSDKAAKLEKKADLLVKNPGGTGVTGFAPGDWVEVTDDERELCRVPGYFARLSYVDGTKFIVDRVLDADGNEGAVSIGEFANPIIRRWDSCSPSKVEISTAETEWIPLEDGVEVQFYKNPGGGEYFQTGDYWLIPARTVNGEIIWHPEESDPEASSRYYRKPDGPRHHFCLLAVCSWSRPAWDVVDCRRFFTPLVNEPAIHITEIGLGGRKRQETDPPDTLNDSVITLDAFARGITLCFDRPIEKAALKLPIVSVVADLPTKYGSQPATLDGTIALNEEDNRAMHWTPSEYILEWLPSVVKKTEKNMLIQVSVKGNLVWGAVNNKPAYLDGVAFGTPDSRNPDRVMLSLPSGDLKRNSDFRMWFWLGTPKACSLQRVPKGGVVFIGEEGLDVSQCVASGTKIGWFRRYEPNHEPDIVFEISKAEGFLVAPSTFVGRTGNWYSAWGTDTPTLAFTVEDPTIDIKIWDNTENKEVTQKGIRFGNLLNFRIDSNLAAVADRCGPSDLPKGFLNIKVKYPDGALLQELRQSATVSIGLTSLAVRSPQSFWVDVSPSVGWKTGFLETAGSPLYKPGTYTVSAELELNKIKDNYKSPDGSDFIGKTVTSTKKTTIHQEKVTIEANKDSISVGEDLTISGANVKADAVYLYLSDARDPRQRFMLTAASKKTVSGNRATFNEVAVGEDGTWKLTWKTSNLRKPIKPGKYLIHIVTAPQFADEVSETEHAVIPVEIRE